jgi:hypothetical protein
MVRGAVVDISVFECSPLWGENGSPLFHGLWVMSYTILLLALSRETVPTPRSAVTAPQLKLFLRAFRGPAHETVHEQSHGRFHGQFRGERVRASKADPLYNSLVFSFTSVFTPTIYSLHSNITQINRRPVPLLRTKASGSFRTPDRNFGLTLRGLSQYSGIPETGNNSEAP